MRILVIDGYPDAAESLCDLLSLIGHQVYCAQSANEALSVAPTFQPELVVSEVVLPSKDGLRVCAELRAILPPATRIILYSGMTHATVRDQATRAGFGELLSKPEIQPLLQLIETLQ